MYIPKETIPKSYRLKDIDNITDEDVIRAIDIFQKLNYGQSAEVSARKRMAKAGITVIPIHHSTGSFKQWGITKGDYLKALEWKILVQREYNPYPYDDHYGMYSSEQDDYQEDEDTAGNITKAIAADSVKNTNKVVLAKIHDVLWEYLEYTSDTQGVSKSDIIRMALMKYYGITDLSLPFSKPTS